MLRSAVADLGPLDVVMFSFLPLDQSAVSCQRPKKKSCVFGFTQEEKLFHPQVSVEWFLGHRSYRSSMSFGHMHNLTILSWNPLPGTHSPRFAAPSTQDLDFWPCLAVPVIFSSGVSHKIFVAIHTQHYCRCFQLKIRSFKPNWEVPTPFVYLQSFDERKTDYIFVCNWVFALDTSPPDFSYPASLKFELTYLSNSSNIFAF